MQRKQLLDCKVIENTSLNQSYFRLVVTSDQPMGQINAGQFAELRVDGSGSTFLRRPISIHNYDSATNRLSLLINKVGDGTRALSRLQPGDMLNIMLPLGNGFGTDCNGRVLLVGGGVGIAPLLMLGKVLKDNGASVSYLLGFRSQKEMLDLSEYSQYGGVYITTEDGSVGEKGFVTAHSLLNGEFDRIYTCGPTPMMRSIAAYAREKGIDCEVSLENKMACGLGACLCCVTQTNEGHKCVCTDGPVFNINELPW